MALEASNRIPSDPDYLVCLGRATWVWAYYESFVVDLIDRLKPGFKTEVARSKRNYTAGTIRSELEKLVNSKSTDFTRISKTELVSVHDQLDTLIDRRNSLIHGRPIGGNILAYQGNVDKPNPDVQWPAAAVDAFTEDVANERIRIDPIFEKLR